MRVARVCVRRASTQEMLTAITRAVSPSMEACELTYLERQAINIVRAREQHRAYEDCLKELGVDVISLRAEPEYPDAVFVEDAAVVLDEVAVMTRMGAVSRRGRAESLARVLEKYRPLRWMREPATLDGGDVMLAGKTLFVGVTARNSAAGIGNWRRRLSLFRISCTAGGGAGVFALEIGVQLHRRCGTGASSVGGRGGVRRGAAGGCAGGVRGECARDRRDGAGAGWGSTDGGTVGRLGRQVRVLDNSELMKAEGALTCCSLIFDGNKTTGQEACPTVTARRRLS